MKLSDPAPMDAAPRRGRRTLYLLLSFAVPFLVLLLAVLALHAAPFGRHSLAIADGRVYINSLAFLRRALQGRENLLYTFTAGPGSNEWANLAWGGLFPAMLLTLLAIPETLPGLFTWICLVNMSLCGLTMYLLLADVRGHRLENLIFSTSYALSGFLVVNCFQYLFFIGPQCLPLVVLGLIWLFRGKSPLLYILSLGGCIFLNFYFGFMLCVVSVLLLLAHLYVNAAALAGKRGRLLGTWAASSVIAGLLGAPM